MNQKKIILNMTLSKILMMKRRTANNLLRKSLKKSMISHKIQILWKQKILLRLYKKNWQKKLVLRVIKQHYVLKMK